MKFLNLSSSQLGKTRYNCFFFNPKKKPPPRYLFFSMKYNQRMRSCHRQSQKTERSHSNKTEPFSFKIPLSRNNTVYSQGFYLFKIGVTGLCLGSPLPTPRPPPLLSNAAGITRMTSRRRLRLRRWTAFHGRPHKHM